MRRRRYQFKGGGLIHKPPTFAAKCKVPASFRLPLPGIDNEAYCLPASNQGNIPACAGYAVAGNIEVWNWQMNDVYKQIDGVAIWKEAHRLSGVTDDEEGTTLELAVNGAESLGLLPKCDIVRLSNLDDVRHAIHKNVVCICGFHVTEEWNYVDVETGRLAWNDKAKDLGLHAVLMFAYNEVHKTLRGMNSWDLSWGKNGTFEILADRAEATFEYGIALKLP